MNNLSFSLAKAEGVNISIEVIDNQIEAIKKEIDNIPSSAGTASDSIYKAFLEADIQVLNKTKELLKTKRDSLHNEVFADIDLNEMA